MEVRVKNAFKYKGRRAAPGEIIQVDPAIIDKLKRMKVIDEDYQSEYETAAELEMVETRENKLKHLGGGWYELPNGKRIRGKEKALQALRG